MKGLRKSKAAFSVKAVPDLDLEVRVGPVSIKFFLALRSSVLSKNKRGAAPPVLSSRSATVKIVYKINSQGVRPWGRASLCKNLLSTPPRFLGVRVGCYHAKTKNFWGSIYNSKIRTTFLKVSLSNQYSLLCTADCYITSKNWPTFMYVCMINAAILY